MSMIELFGQQMSESDAEYMISEDARTLIEQLRARNAELERQVEEERESWKDLRNVLECTQGELAAMEKRAEQAEKRIAESRRQEPVGKVCEDEMTITWDWANNSMKAGDYVYRFPIVTPDVEEAVRAALEEADERLRAAGWVAAADLRKEKE